MGGGMIDHSASINRIMAEREAFAAGSLDWLYRSRAAWKLHQHLLRRAGEGVQRIAPRPVGGHYGGKARDAALFALLAVRDIHRPRQSHDAVGIVAGIGLQVCFNFQVSGFDHIKQSRKV